MRGFLYIFDSFLCFLPTICHPSSSNSLIPPESLVLFPLSSPQDHFFIIIMICKRVQIGLPTSSSSLKISVKLCVHLLPGLSCVCVCTCIWDFHESYENLYINRIIPWKKENALSLWNLEPGVWQIAFLLFDYPLTSLWSWECQVCLALIPALKVVGCLNTQFVT